MKVSEFRKFYEQYLHIDPELPPYMQELLDELDEKEKEKEENFIGKDWL